MKNLVLIFSLLLFVNCNNDDDNGNPISEIPDTLPDVSMATFTNSINITNPYYGPAASQTYVYLGQEISGDDEEEIIIERRNSTKVVMGITCIIHHDRVYKDGILIEDTDDWLAQDDAGNLWYFGEAVKNYDDDGTYSDDDGSWEAGVDGALPGYWFPASPRVGQRYYQEFYEGEAEDQAEVISINQSVTIGATTYENCIVTKDYSDLESNIYELKYYAPNIGNVKEEEFEDGELIEQVELTEIQQ